MPKSKNAGGPGVLDRIAATKAVEVRALEPSREALRQAAGSAPPPRDFAAALRGGADVRLLAEVKRRSPSAGEIRPGADAAEIAAAYERGGAAALSVLTDRDYFGGDLDALRAARAATKLPVLRKDFIVDVVQLWEARAAGADAVLLIARMLDDAALRALHAEATSLGMAALVEVHDEEELARALAAGATLVGVNNRDLQTFFTDLALSLRLASRVPPGVTLVAESGIRTADDVRRLGHAGVDAVLVGESLMRQPDVAAAAAALGGVPRRPRG